MFFAIYSTDEISPNRVINVLSADELPTDLPINTLVAQVSEDDYNTFIENQNTITFTFSDGSIIFDELIVSKSSKVTDATIFKTSIDKFIIDGFGGFIEVENTIENLNYLFNTVKNQQTNCGTIPNTIVIMGQTFTDFNFTEFLSFLEISSCTRATNDKIYTTIVSDIMSAESIEEVEAIDITLGYSQVRTFPGEILT